jgi:hypothetical protein
MMPKHLRSEEVVDENAGSLADDTQLLDSRHFISVLIIKSHNSLIDRIYGSCEEPP